MSKYTIMVRDRNLAYRGIIDDYRQFEFISRYNALGSWQLEIDYNSPGAKALLSAFSEKDGSQNPLNKGLTGITVLKGSQLVFSGPIRQLEERWSQEGHILTIGGPDDLVFLNERIFLMSPYAYQTSYTTDYYYTSGSAEFVIKEIVKTQLGSLAGASRQLANLTVPASTSRGFNPCSTRGRFQNVLREIQDIAAFSENRGSRLGFYLRQSGTGFVFDVYVPTDKSQTVIFSPAFGNVGEYTYTQEAPAGNMIIGGDKGSGTTRGFQFAGDEPSRKLYGEKEMFVDGSHSAAGELLNEVYKALEENAEKTGFVFTPLEQPGFEFITNWREGDLIKFKKDSESLTDIVREVHVALSDGEEKITLAMGTATLGRTLRLFDKTRNLEYRANDQERY
jgi:hypothetical protein